MVGHTSMQREEICKFCKIIWLKFLSDEFRNLWQGQKSLYEYHVAIVYTISQQPPRNNEVIGWLEKIFLYFILINFNFLFLFLCILKFKNIKIKFIKNCWPSGHPTKEDFFSKISSLKKSTFIHVENFFFILTATWSFCDINRSCAMKYEILDVYK